MIKQIFNNFRSSSNDLKYILLKEPFDIEIASKLLELKKIDINILDEDENSLLDITLMNNRFKAASWLISNGIKINRDNKKQISASRLAIEKGNHEVVDSLLNHKDFNINQTDKNGRTLLQDAVILGHSEIAHKLINNNIDVNIKDMHNRNVMFDAISYGDENIINKIANIKDIDLNLIDSDGKTILHDKKVLENDNIATTLLEKGADPTICDKDGMNFLTATALRGEAGEAMLQVAIKCGCDLNAKVANDNTILMEVMFTFAKLSDTEKQRRDGLKSIARTLIKHGIKIDAINKDGETVLFNLIRLQDIEGCAFLLEQDIDVNKVNNSYETVLSIAILKGIENIDLVILLIQYGANPLIKDKHNQTVLEVLNTIILHVHNLKKLKNKELLEKINPVGNYMLILKEILASRKFDFNYLDSAGEPLFFLPFLYGDMKTCKLYFKYDLDVNLSNKEGHNIFYEYVLKIFELNLFDDKFKENLIFLMLNNVDITSQDKKGQTIYTKIASIHNCNLKLFRKLIEVTRYNYLSLDKMGRTIMHACVLSNNLELLKLIYGVQRNIQNIADNYNILPITYAAILGHKDIVVEFLRKDAIITSGKPISKLAKEQFKDLIKNVDNLSDDITDRDLIKNLKIFQKQVKDDLAL